MRVAILHPYFGNIPPWWDIYIHGVGANSNIDFYYFTDLNLPTYGFENVKVVQISFQEIISLATKVLGFEVKISTPYKLCDLKPSYGQLFSEYIAAYDLWGHADVDVFYGNIQSWLTNNLLKEYDIISCRKHIISGQFTVYKNKKITNELYKNILGFERLLNSNILNYIDEKYMTEAVMNAAVGGQLQFYGEDALVEDALSETRGRKRLLLLFREGKIFDPIFKREYFMFHFIHSKKREEFLQSLCLLNHLRNNKIIFHCDKLLPFTMQILCKCLVEASFFDLWYIFKRLYKKFILCLDSSNY